MAVSRGGAAWSARLAHNQQVAGSNPAPATKKGVSCFGRSFLFRAFATQHAKRARFIVRNFSVPRPTD